LGCTSTGNAPQRLGGARTWAARLVGPLAVFLRLGCSAPWAAARSAGPPESSVASLACPSKPSIEQQLAAAWTRRRSPARRRARRRAIAAPTMLQRLTLHSAFLARELSSGSLKNKSQKGKNKNESETFNSNYRIKS